MTNSQRRLTRDLHVANGWSSDQPGNGLPLLSLGTTRRIDSEHHGTKAGAEIDANVAWNRAWTGTSDQSNDPTRDIPALVDLRKLVVDAAIGAEWMSDAQILRFAEELYQASELH